MTRELQCLSKYHEGIVYTTIQVTTARGHSYGVKCQTSKLLSQTTPIGIIIEEYMTKTVEVMSVRMGIGQTD